MSRSLSKNCSKIYFSIRNQIAPCGIFFRGEVVVDMLFLFFSPFSSTLRILIRRCHQHPCCTLAQCQSLKINLLIRCFDDVARMSATRVRLLIRVRILRFGTTKRAAHLSLQINLLCDVWVPLTHHRLSVLSYYLGV